MMSAYRTEWPAWLDWSASNLSSTPTRSQNSGVIGGCHLYCAGTANQYIEWPFASAAGTFTLSVMRYGAAGSASAVQTSIDGANAGSAIDFGTGAANTVTEISGIALTEGAHTLRLTTNNTDPFRVEWFSLERTGA